MLPRCRRHRKTERLGRRARKFEFWREMRVRPIGRQCKSCAAVILDRRSFDCSIDIIPPPAKRGGASGVLDGDGAFRSIFANFANSPFLEFLARNFPPDVMRFDRFGDGPRQIARWASTGKSD